MISTARKLLTFLDSRSRIHVALLLLPMLAVALLEMASIGLILPVVQILLLGETDGIATKVLLAVLPEVPADRLPVWVAGTFAVFFVTKNILLLGLIYVVNRVVYVKMALFSTRMYALYLSQPLVFHYQRNSAEILRNLISGCALAYEALRHVLLMMLDGLLLVSVFFLLVIVEPEMTLAVTIVLVIVGLTFYRISSPVFQFWGERMMTIETSLIKWINQSLASIRDVKLQHLYDYMSLVYSRFAYMWTLFGARSATAMHIPRFVIETVVVIGFLAAVLGLLATKETPSDVIAILGLYGMAALRLMPSLNRILTSAAELKERTAFINELYSDLVTGTENSDREAPKAGGQAFDYSREIRLENITYTYPDAVHHAVHDIGVAIEKGQSVGFVGPSGAGKTTLVDVILGLLRPQSGTLLIDGVNALANLPAWQRRIGYVPQQVSLIDDTFSRNIAFGVPDTEIDEDRVREVVRLARLEDTVARLPDKLSTVLGEGGVRLSGGQRQRVSIARALYRDPDVLVFDEATSSLDTETEREITEAIETLAGDRTILIIAHRLSTVRNCDKLVFMKEGRVAAVGRFDELVQDNVEFRRLAQASDIDSGRQEMPATKVDK